jgi:branched-chain amino acid transport system ATP-binding protein
MSLSVEGVSASYGNIQVLWDLSITVGKGEIVSLIGSNGAGKSTLLRSVVGLVKIQKGSISFEGTRLGLMSTHSRVRQGISYVPEGRRLFSTMTVEENLLMGAKRGSPNLEKQLGRIYELFPILRGRKKQRAGNLSGGEQQMLAIGRALMSEPRLVLMDELSAGLAPVMFDRVLDSIAEINKLGVSILLAEQNSERALQVSSRSYVIENGRIALEGVSADMLDSPSVRRAYLGIKEEST